MIGESQRVGRRPTRLTFAAVLLGLTGLAFVGGAAVLAYGTWVNSPAVAQLFGFISVLLIGMAALHFVAARGIWSRRRWAALLGIVLSLAGAAIPAYIAFDILTHTANSLRDTVLYLALALPYAACLFSLLTSGRTLREN